MANSPNHYKTDGICRCYTNSKGTKIVCWVHWPFPIEGMTGRPPATSNLRARLIAPKQRELFGDMA